MNRGHPATTRVRWRVGGRYHQSKNKARKEFWSSPSGGDKNKGQKKRKTQGTETQTWDQTVTMCSRVPAKPKPKTGNPPRKHPRDIQAKRSFDVGVLSWQVQNAGGLRDGKGGENGHPQQTQKIKDKTGITAETEGNRASCC